MKKTSLHEIYNYLRDYKCDLDVEVKEGVKTLTKGNASTTHSNTGSIYINGIQFTTDNNEDQYTFYANYPEFTLSGAIGACTVSGGSKKNKRKSKKSNKKRKARTRARKYR